ncbi:MAG TPA: ECF-type sigma factor [Candidatus Cybelea sp.]|nr:ECF-type sigma factor [Candidatus Cybelea sp.]
MGPALSKQLSEFLFDWKGGDREALQAVFPPCLQRITASTDRLAKLNARQNQIVELGHLTGLSIEDTTEFLGVSSATVKRCRASASAW